MSVIYSGTGITFDDGSVQTNSWTGFKNRIINGDMRIDQRNNGSSVSITLGTSNGFVVDRWRFQNAGGSSSVFSAQRVTDAPAGFTNSLKVTTTTAASTQAADSKHLWLPIEGFDTADLDFGTASAKTVTLSFWVKSSKTGNFGAAISNDGAARAYSFLYNISQADTWEYKTVTIPGDTVAPAWSKNNFTGMRVNFNIGSGSNYTTVPNQWGAGPDRGANGQITLLDTLNATWQITGVQLERGSQASSFEYRPYGTELALCQRYYWRISGFSGPSGYPSVGSGTLRASNIARLYVKFPVSMRSAPTLNFSGSISGTSGVVENTVSSIYGQYASTETSLFDLLFSATTFTTGYGVTVFVNNASTNYVEASAEL